MVSPLVVQRVDLGIRTIPYAEGWALQRRVHTEVATGQRPNTLLLLEHDAVYTAGSRTQPQDRPRDGSPVIDVDRGGRITWHGPGQLVGYPIVQLTHHMDVIAHVRALEDLIMTVSTGYGVRGFRIEGRSGVWVDGACGPEKVAAIGVRVARGVTMHGFAINCDCDLYWRERIVPCGIEDAGVTSLSEVTGRRIMVTEVADAVEAAVTA